MAVTLRRVGSRASFRSAAANIASVPCRCGHNCTYGPGPRSSAGANSAAGVQRGHRMAPQRIGDHADGLGQVRRTGRVQHHAAGSGQRDRRRRAARAAAWPAPEHRPGCAAIGLPGAGAAHRGRCRARRRGPGRNRPAGSAVSRPSTRSTSTARPRVFCSTISARRGLRFDRGDGCRPAGRRWQRSGPSCRRARRTGPASVRRRRRSAGPGSAPGPPAGCPRPEPAPDRRGSEPAGRGRRRRGTPRTASTGRPHRRPSRPVRSAVRTPGPGGQVHAGTGVVGGQCGVEFAGVGAECVGERLGDPARMGVHECRMTDRVGGCRRRQLGHPGLPRRARRSSAALH